MLQHKGKRKLLAEENLSLKPAVELVQGMETAERSLNALKDSDREAPVAVQNVSSERSAYTTNTILNVMFQAWGIRAFA